MKVERFSSSLCASSDADYEEDLFCMNEFCYSMMHRRTIRQYWDKLIRIILATGTTVFGSKSRQTYIKPRRSEYVKNCYEESRRAFLQWRRDGSPRNGVSANLMRQKRALFELTLKQCKHDEELMRTEALASKLRSGKVPSFWSEVSRMTGRVKKLPQSNDQVSGDEEISKLWKEKYSGVLNSIVGHSDRDDLLVKMSGMPRSIMKFVVQRRYVSPQVNSQTIRAVD